MRAPLFIAVLLAGCGAARNVSPAQHDAAVATTAAPSSAASSAAPVVGTSTPSATIPAVPPGRLGHYSSGDGLTGIVLDRTGPLPKVRVDGTTEMVVLEPQNVKTAEHADFVDVKAHLFVRLGSNGAVTFARGGISKEMTRDGDADSPGKLRLGHYSSGDGLTGFVLDRTSPKPRMRLDGTPGIVDMDVVELDVEPASGGETSLAVLLRGVVLRLGTHGEVTFFRGNESIPMRRDADAAPLR